MRAHGRLILACLISSLSVGAVSNADELRIDPEAMEISTKTVSCFANGVLVDWPPINYPAACVEGASEKESVVVRWDLAVEGGSPLNIVVVESSNVCFNDTVIEGITKRKYPPISECQSDAQVRGLMDVFVFNRTD